MFDHKHYVPILRWKEAERLALRDLENTVKSRVTPLVQLTPESIALRVRIRTHSQALQKVAGDIAQYWGARLLLVDLRLVDPALRIGGRTHPLAYLAQQARTNSVRMVPVTGLHRDRAYQIATTEIVDEDGRGACIRLFRNDLQSSALHGQMSALLGELGLEPSQVDLLVDLQCCNGTCPSIREVESRLPALLSWRTFTLASGAFPRDLTGLSVGRHVLPRLDWREWWRQIEPGESLARKPTHSDYAIYHPIYAPPEFANPSASIRYTSDREWVVMRGEGVLNEGGPGYAQWPANAQLLA